MSFLISGLYGLLALAGALAVRAFAAMAFIGLLAIVALPAVFTFYWLTVLYDGVVGVRRIGQLRWRRDSYYTPGHLWLRPLTPQLVRVGVDEIGQRVLPDVESIALAQAGTRVAEGQPIADIRCGHGGVVLRSPVDGTIAFANPRLTRTPALLNRDSYRRAWLVDIEPRNGALDRWVFGRRARTWLADEERRLTGFFERGLGMAAADGGELVHTSPAMLSDDQWREMRAAFLEPSAYVDPTVSQN
jgi:glycine cleavage system H protein